MVVENYAHSTYFPSNYFLFLFSVHTIVTIQLEIFDYLIIDVKRWSNYCLVKFQWRISMVWTNLISVAIIPFKRKFWDVQTYSNNSIHRAHRVFNFIRDLSIRRIFGHHIVQNNSKFSELMILKLNIDVMIINELTMWYKYTIFISWINLC